MNHVGSFSQKCVGARHNGRLMFAHTTVGRLAILSCVNNIELIVHRIKMRLLHYDEPSALLCFVCLSQHEHSFATATRTPSPSSDKSNWSARSNKYDPSFHSPGAFSLAFRRKHRTHHNTQFRPFIGCKMRAAATAKCRFRLSLFKFWRRSCTSWCYVEMCKDFKLN